MTLLRRSAGLAAILLPLALVACDGKGGDTGDGGTTDGGTTDGGSTDGGSTDGGTTDGGSTDGGTTDGGTTDGGTTDGPGDTGDTGAGTDGGTDGGGDTGDTGAGEACGVRELIWYAEVRDASGTAGSSFPASASLTMVGGVRNPCDEAVSFETTSTCLVTSWEVTDADGRGGGMGQACGGAITTWTLAPGDSAEEDASWGTLRVQDYRLDIVYETAAPITSSTSFEIY